jgi:hypothetical protein
MSQKFEPGPPKKVEASELFLKLMEAPRPSEVVDFPRLDKDGKPIAQVRIQVLRMDEHDQARIVAQQKLKARRVANEDLSSAAIKEVLGDAVAKELIAMACLTVEPMQESEPPVYGRIFRDGEDVGKLSTDEVLVLFNAYTLVQHKYGPFERTITSAEDIDAWIKRLVEGGDVFPLSSLDLPALAELTLSLAQRVHSICTILASQWSSLPPTLVASLESCSMAISSYGERHADSEQTGGASSLDEPLTLEDALRFALAVKG